VQQRILNFDDLIAFLKAFHALKFGSPEEFKLDESRVPSDLPLPLRRLYLEFGALIERSSGPFRTLDALVPPAQIEQHKDQIEFVWQNQGNWTCRCALNALNPPILSDAGDWHPEFKLLSTLLEHFLTTFCLQKAVMSCPDLIVLKTGAEDAFTKKLRPLWLDGYYVYDMSTHAFYTLENETALVMQFHGEWWIGGPNATVQHILCDETPYRVISPW
jgi:hypothetical protein